MSSFTTSRGIRLNRSSPDKIVYTTHDWTIVEAFLESGAGGSNNLLRFGGGSGFRYNPGDSRRHFVAPDTRIEIETNAEADVEWSFVFTQIDAIGAVIRALTAMHGQLDDLRCGLVGDLEQAAHRPLSDAAPRAVKGAPDVEEVVRDLERFKPPTRVTREGVDVVTLPEPAPTPRQVKRQPAEAAPVPEPEPAPTTRSMPVTRQERVAQQTRTPPSTPITRDKRTAASSQPSRFTRLPAPTRFGKP